MTFTGLIGRVCMFPLRAIMSASVALGSHPNMLTLIGVLINVAAAWALGKDQFLLIRNGDDRKQLLREDANQDVCIVAIAGDQRSDFDELFDYLRDPNAAIGLDAMLGDGWFLVPPPLESSRP